MTYTNRKVDSDIANQWWFKIYTTLAFFAILITGLWAIENYNEGTMGILGVVGILIAAILLGTIPLVILGRLHHQKQLH